MKDRAWLVNVTTGNSEQVDWGKGAIAVLAGDINVRLSKTGKLVCLFWKRRERASPVVNTPVLVLILATLIGCVHSIERRSNFGILSDARQASNVDFQASTFAIQTTCKPISQTCGLNPAFEASTPFKCTPSFSGDATAEDPNDNYGGSETVNNFNKNISSQSKQLNPFNLGTWARVYSNPFNPSVGGKEFNLDQDPEIITPVHGGLAWVLGCSSVVYDLTYSWVNGSFGGDWRQSNGSISQILAAPFHYGLACSNLNNLAITSSFTDTADEMAEKWSTGFSQIAMPLAVGIVSPRQNLQEQSRTSMLVSRVPKAPLFTLIGLNLLYALLGILLVLYTLCFAKPSETRDVQARLTLSGLASFCFEDEGRARAPVEKVERLFEERAG